MAVYKQLSCSIILTVLFVLIGDIFIDAYPSGAPRCMSFIPKHKDNTQQQFPSPYEITVSNNTVKAGQKILVTVTVSDKERQSTVTFKGVHLRAINRATDSVFGNFIVSETETSYHTLDCGTATTTQGAVTHSNPSPKRRLEVTWVAPFETTEVIFTATVVEQFTTFWVGIQSAPVRVLPGDSSGGNTVSISPTPALDAPLNKAYVGCGQTKSCFGMPGGDRCISAGNCIVLATFVKRRSSDLIDFELIGNVGGIDANAYVALGLSDDESMGGDSVRECIVRSGEVTGSESFNVPNRKANDIVGQMELTDKSFDDGMLSCKFTLKPQFVSNNVPFNLIEKNYHVLLALGPMGSSGDVLAKHVDMLPSANAFNFTAIETSRSASINTLIAIHGCLMVAAWVGTVSVAIFLARYYKQMWPKTTHCKVRVWFAWHRSLNTLTILMSTAAFIIIFIHVNGFSSEWPANPHPVTGIITFALMWLQPIGAVFRCDPNASRRPIFNWLHFLGGMIAVILAVVTMFWAVTLHAVDLPQYFWWILIAYVAFFVVTFATMEFFTCLDARNADKDSIAMQNYPGAAGTNIQSATSPTLMFNDRQTRFKQVMLILFIAGAICFSAALIVVIATS